MIFTLSKMFWIIANPGNLLVIILTLGLLSLIFRWRRLGVGLIGIAVIASLVITTVPLGKYLLFQLENRFPPVRSLPVKADGIIVLGGFSNQFITKARGQVALGGAVERLFEAAVLARRYPEAKVLFTGGSGDLFRQEIKESETLGPAFKVLGLKNDRILLESNSRNTYENAVFTHNIIKPTMDQTWFLVTSAFHMPRSVGTFKKNGWNVIPYPVDYNIEGTKDLELGFDFIGGLSSLNKGMHEWIGLIAYKLLGRSDSYFPSPDKRK